MSNSLSNATRHAFTIDATTHADFLNEERKDPITGEIIQIGDEVVFCASCKSVFLKDSWAYIGNTHCEQPHTLAHFPKNTTLALQKPLSLPFRAQDAQLASMHERILAMTIDGAVSITIGSFLIAMLIFVGKYIALFGNLGKLFSGVFMVSGVVVVIAALLGRDAWLGGSSLSKYILGIRTVQEENGQKPTFSQAIMRSMLSIFDFNELSSWRLTGKSRSDVLTHTIVIKEKSNN